MSADVKAKKYEKDMTKGKISSLMIAFALPIMLSQLFQQLYNTADSFIVGNYLGTFALAAVSSSGTLIFLMISFFVGLTMGAGIVISRYFGANDKDKVSRAIHTNIVVGLLCGVILTVVGVLFTPTLLKWMNTDEEYLPLAIEYFRVYFLGGVPMVMYNVARGTMNAIGDSKRPLYYLIISSIVNIILDILFVGVFRWGVWSAAFATVISQLFSAVVCFIHLFKKDQVFTVSVKKLKIDKEMFKQIIRFGVPSAVQNSVIALANVIVQTQINTFKAVATAAYGSYSKIEGFAFLPINSFTMAISTFVGQNMGAGERERAKKGARFGILACVITAEVIGVLIFIIAPYLIKLFDSNPEVIFYGTKQARTASLFYGLLAFSHAVGATCRGAGKAFVPMLVMLIIWCVIRIIYILIVMKLFGDISYIYWAYPITWGMSTIVFALYYKFSHWERGFGAKADLINNDN